MNYNAVEREVEAGRFWRAKEMLQGRLASPEFDLELLRRYGEVLLAMRDLIEAGRMFFCAGVRDERYIESINIFLSKSLTKDAVSFLSTLPLMVRRQRHLADFIASKEFEANGWSKVALESVKPVTQKAPAINSSSGWIKERAIQVFSAGLFLLFFIIFGVGMITTLSTIWSLIK